MDIANVPLVGLSGNEYGSSASNHGHKKDGTYRAKVIDRQKRPETPTPCADKVEEVKPVNLISTLAEQVPDTQPTEEEGYRGANQKNQQGGKLPVVAPIIEGNSVKASIRNSP